MQFINCKHTLITICTPTRVQTRARRAPRTRALAHAHAWLPGRADSAPHGGALPALARGDRGAAFGGAVPRPPAAAHSLAYR